MKKILIVLVAALAITSSGFGKSGPYSRPSSSGSSHSSSSYSRPSGSSSSYSRPSGSSSSYSKPSGSSSSYSKPSGSSSSYSKPSSPSGYVKPSYSPSPSGYVKPNYSDNKDKKSSSPSYSKPSTSSSYDSGAVKTKAREESKMAYEKDHPKPGTAKPSHSTPHSSPPPRTVEKHYYHYYPRYDYYRSLPPVYVGGGYSSIFWYSMLEWDIQRRALWLYNHQSEIDSRLYAEQMQNAALRQEIDRIRASNSPVNPQYVDPQFKDNPDVMYDRPTTSIGWVIFWTLFSVLGGAGIIVLVVWLVFYKDWN